MVLLSFRTRIHSISNEKFLEKKNRPLSLELLALETYPAMVFREIPEDVLTTLGFLPSFLSSPWSPKKKYSPQFGQSRWKHYHVRNKRYERHKKRRTK
jgi:hypothetical protein